MIRVGVIGTGIMGAGHAKFLTNQVEGAVVTALSDIDLDRAKKLADEIKTVKLITDNVDEITAVKILFQDWKAVQGIGSFGQV